MLLLMPARDIYALSKNFTDLLMNTVSTNVADESFALRHGTAVGSVTSWTFLMRNPQMVNQNTFTM